MHNGGVNVSGFNLSPPIARLDKDKDYSTCQSDGIVKQEKS